MHRDATVKVAEALVGPGSCLRLGHAVCDEFLHPPLEVMAELGLDVAAPYPEAAPTRDLPHLASAPLRPRTLLTASVWLTHSFNSLRRAMRPSGVRS